MSEEKFTFRQRWFPSLDDACDMNENHDGASFLGRWARSIIVGSTLLWAVCQGVGNNIHYSGGDRVGVINKISKKGVFWETYEGEMALEGLIGGQSTGANLWDFSIDKQSRKGENVDSLYKVIKQYMEDGQRVKITYDQPFATWPWRSETDYLVQRVEPADRKK